MSIKFVCSCGKHLRARDEMAERRSMCPRCGAPVGVPSLRPTHAGTTAAPLTPQERRRLRSDKPSADAASGVAFSAPRACVSRSAARGAGRRKSAANWNGMAINAWLIPSSTGACCWALP